jgi:DNA gyrase/topoisomerase IV subunit A
MFISAEGIVIRVKASEISVMGRLTQGVRVMTMGEGDSLVSMAKIATKDEGNGTGRVQAEGESEGPSGGMEELPLPPIEPGEES